jgi:hypothetical protein
MLILKLHVSAVTPDWASDYALNVHNGADTSPLLTSPHLLCFFGTQNGFENATNFLMKSYLSKTG